MDGVPFIDTNVFVRYVMNDHLEHSPRSTALFERIERGEIIVCTVETAIFECVYTLQSVFRVPREQISETIGTLLALEGLRVSRKQQLLDAFDLYLDHRRLSFGDCFHAVMAKRLNAPELISFDRGFDRVPWINRTEPT